jgi:arginyl-tRNA synthetase
LYSQLQRRLAEHVRAFLRRQYDVELPNIVIEQPPQIAMGEYALPLSFELARKLRKPPRKIAEEIVANIGSVEGFEGFEVAGAGYINARLKRGAVAQAFLGGEDKVYTPEHGKTLVEHTSINPNKAAHVGHLRNAILGDTFVRLLRAAEREVDVQNYIDNTGVQVADVVVGFVYLEKKSREQIEALATSSHRFDYYCWDLYARVSHWYEQSADNKQKRSDTLHAIERGGNEVAEIAALISTAVLRRHLETMDRLAIDYDFLPRESEILSLHFWDLAFQQMKEKGVLYFENEGKNKGCWVMTRPSASGRRGNANGDIDAKQLRMDTIVAPGQPESSSGIRITHIPTGIIVTSQQEGSQQANRECAMTMLRERLAEHQPEGPDEDAKVIVRSNGTVGYVGKDIAYHLWKFGLLGRDFEYRRFYQYPNGHDVWISAHDHGEADHPHFGGVEAIYNVIDARQAEPQNTVIEALRALGYAKQADHYTHFSYEMVALTPRCAQELGYELSEDEWARSYIEVSGRKGFGVKADDLLDKLIASAQHEVDSRHPEMPEAERKNIARQIAVGALRYFMLKFTKNSVIAFDFKDALSFEGETGPYAQYAVVRATNIFRKAGLEPERMFGDGSDFSAFLSDDGIWELWLMSAKTSQAIETSIATTEPAFVAKHAFQLAQMFNNFYHKHHILTEADEQRQRFLLATAAVVRRELIRVLAVMGIEAPPVM